MSAVAQSQSRPELELDQWYVVPDLGPEDEYNVEKWLLPLRQWKFRGYSPLTAYRLVPLNDREIVALRRGNMDHFLAGLRQQVTRVLANGPMFLRLNTRSPKDAWQVMAPELECSGEPSSASNQDKQKRQLELLRVSSFEQVCTVLRASQRAIRDMDQVLEQTATSTSTQLFLVFQKWRPSVGPEYRAFVQAGRMICACDCSTQTPVSYDEGQLLSEFCESLATALPQLPHFVVDAFISSESQQCCFIEINPYSLSTDAICFEWGSGPLRDSASHCLV
jgi:hypothetical protein